MAIKKRLNGKEQAALKAKLRWVGLILCERRKLKNNIKEKGNMIKAVKVVNQATWQINCGEFHWQIIIIIQPKL